MLRADGKELIMARRAAYTKVERKNFSNPDHVKGMGDKTFRGFQCLEKDCTEFIFIQAETIDPDFHIECPTCGFVHQAGETTSLYDYELIDTRDNSEIESGPFEILHDDYVGESKEFKYCIVCGALKPFELFDTHRSRRTGRQGECRTCKQVYNSIKNQTRLVEQHREASQKRRLYTHFEERDKMDIAAIYERFGNQCFKCGLDLASDLTAGVARKEGNLDHTLPVFYLWPLTTNNATLLCREHNGEKAEKWPSVYYSDAELRRLSALTGIEYGELSGEPIFNPHALKTLEDPSFVEALFEKFARHPDELLRLRNRILRETGFDFLDTSAKISPDWKLQADALLS
ncbi:hypothetical protein [uncultured Tateyamaria sp.]|uniref:hypothetical protein n=1 Tax=uncultured Tateyamaria sp. TaxID=455651 RepID=UPI0026389CC2|nr:hypothetical protein [uncultured Tateyamaria sp.]